MTNDLISRSELLREIDAFMNRFAYDTDRILVDSFIRNASAIDAEPVRHGEWSDYRINGYDGLHPVYETQCSLCGGYARFTYRFCPHCGARMDGGTDNDYRHDHQ